MKRIQILLLAVFFACVQPFGCAPADPVVIHLDQLDASVLPYAFKLGETLSSGRYEAHDLNHDGQDEFIVMSNNPDKWHTPNFIILEPYGSRHALFNREFLREISLGIPCPDIQGDGWDEIFVAEHSPDTLFVHVIDHTGETLRTLAASVRPAHLKTTWDCIATPYCFTDLDGDGYQDAILVLQTGYAYQPRGLLAWDMRNDRILWEFRTGAISNPPVLVDINGDGAREILFGSSAPNNSARFPESRRMVNGTDDAHSYLFVLDSLGRLLYRQGMGGDKSFVRVDARDLDGDSEPECIVSFSSVGEPWRPSYLARWNPDNGILTHKIERSQNVGKDLAFLDSDRDGKCDVLIYWEDGFIEIRDFRNEILRQVQFPGLRISRVQIMDLDRDAEEEILISGKYQSGQVNLILDRRLRLLARTGSAFTEYTIQQTVQDGYSRPLMLLAMADQDGGQYFTMHIVKRLAPSLLAHWYWVVLGLASGLILFSVGWGATMGMRREKATDRMLDALAGADIDPAMILDSKGKVLRVNGAMMREFGLGVEIQGKPWEEIGDFEIGEKLESWIQNASSNGYINPPDLHLSGMNRKDWMVRGKWILPGEQDLFLIRFWDETEPSRAGNAMKWAEVAQKLAHEVKTPLSTVILSAERMQMQPKKKEDTHRIDRHVENIIQQAKRLQKMTDAFLRFCRIEKPCFESLDLNRAIDLVAGGFQLWIGKDVEVEKALDKSLPKIEMDPQQIHVVFKNLIENSLKAMGGKGKLTLTTRLIESLIPDRNGCECCVQAEITDTGCGIASEDLDHVFDPFFSKSENGTGLGLLICKKIIEEHQGDIKIESQQGTGTRIVITLPLIQDHKH